MCYMMLIYSKEQPGATRDMSTRNYAGYRAVTDEAAHKGVFEAAEPLAPPSTATTVRVDGGKTVITGLDHALTRNG
jgi:hypothetical protein